MNLVRRYALAEVKAVALYPTANQIRQYYHHERLDKRTDGEGPAREPEKRPNRTLPNNNSRQINSWGNGIERDLAISQE